MLTKVGRDVADPQTPVGIASHGGRAYQAGERGRVAPLELARCLEEGCRRNHRVAV